MYLPERFFPELKIEPPIVEALLVPFHVEDQPVGTVWVVTHTDDRKFDQQDERIIKTSPTLLRLDDSYGTLEEPLKPVPLPPGMTWWTA
jgi:hypothetical protein